ncbi:hypothetical protein BVX98_05435, partial [bacterium F11]
MARKKRRGLKFKLAFFATLLVVLVATTFGYFILQGQKKAIVKSDRENRIGIVKGLRQVVREAILVDDDTDMVNFIKLLKRSQPKGYAMVIEPDGEIRVHTNFNLIGTTLTDEATQKALVYRNRSYPLFQDLIQETEGKKRKILDLSLPVVIGVNPPKYHGVARVGFDKAEIVTEINRSHRKSVGQIQVAFIVAIICGLLGALLLATFITRPLRTLQMGS